MTGFDDIVCEFALCTLSLFIEFWISSGCLRQFNEVYVQGEKSQYNCYTTTTYEVHAFKNGNKRKSLRDIFVYRFVFYICLFGAANKH